MFRHLIFLIAFALEANAQTTVYAATPEGLPDRSHYCAFNYGKYFVCDSCNLSINDTSSFEEYHTVVFFEDRITINFGKTITPKIFHMLFGYVTDEKKIFFARIEKKEDQVNLSFDPTTEEMKNAPYTYDKKVYDANGNIIAFIEGDEKFGAAWYLITYKSKAP